VPQIEVKFDIDVNGILNVSAKDMASGKEKSVRIEESGGLSDEDIERIRKDADAHAAEDKQRRKLAEARNKASSLSYEIEKTMKEHADKLDAGSKAALESSIAKVNEAAKGEDVAAIEIAVGELEQAAHALSKHMYSEAGAGQGGPEAAHQPAGATAGDDDVIDAEFEKSE
jgi:molecular chaperone DnaK